MTLRRSIASRMHADSPIARLAIQAYGRVHGVNVRFESNLIAFLSGGNEIRISSSKIPYARDMILHFSSYHGAVHPDQQGVVDFSEPRLHRYSKSGVTFFLPSIAEEEDAIESYFRFYRPKRGDMVFDIGAHAGVSTYFLSQAVGPTGRVYAFEPDPQAWICLIRNIECHARAKGDRRQIWADGVSGGRGPRLGARQSRFP